MKKKSLKFVLQSKGGAGKSVLSFMIAEKYKDCGIVDADDATKTSSAQLKYRNPRSLTLLNKNNMIDRAMLDAWFEMIATAKKTMYVCDMGASISEQMPYYLSDVMEFLPSVFDELGLEVEFYCVIGGSNIFAPCFEYLSEYKE
jgi:hypothetical protein